MRAVIQRVSSASVTIGGKTQGKIGAGLLILLGVGESDTEHECRYLAEKCATLRIFEDEAGKMNRSLSETGGAVLIVSNFTLYGDCRKGRRPNFMNSARPELAEPLYEQFCNQLRALGIPVQTGRFGADMKVSLTNDGPVTLMLDTADMLAQKNGKAL